MHAARFFHFNTPIIFNHSFETEAQSMLQITLELRFAHHILLFSRLRCFRHPDVHDVHRSESRQYSRLR